jgi:hypothetical protein
VLYDVEQLSIDHASPDAERVAVILLAEPQQA